MFYFAFPFFAVLLFLIDYMLKKVYIQYLQSQFTLPLFFPQVMKNVLLKLFPSTSDKMKTSCSIFISSPTLSISSTCCSISFNFVCSINLISVSITLGFSKNLGVKVSNLSCSVLFSTEFHIFNQAKPSHRFPSSSFGGVFDEKKSFDFVISQSRVSLGFFLFEYWVSQFFWKSRKSSGFVTLLCKRQNPSRDFAEYFLFRWQTANSADIPTDCFLSLTTFGVSCNTCFKQIVWIVVVVTSFYGAEFHTVIIFHVFIWHGKSYGRLNIWFLFLR